MTAGITDNRTILEKADLALSDLTAAGVLQPAQAQRFIRILIDKSDECHGYWELAEHEQPEVDKTVIAYDAQTGKRLWTVKGENLKHLTPSVRSMPTCAI